MAELKRKRDTMKIKIIPFVVLAVAVVGALLSWHHMIRTPKQQTGRVAKPSAVGNESNPVAKSLPVPTAPETLSSAVVSNSSETPPFAQVEKPATKTNARPPATQAQTNQRLMYNGYPVQDLWARVALYFVGTGDPEANAYWESAVFDPNLPAEERKDLIEDLNETGMADPQHPGPADLPLILARIRLIQQLAPYSIDRVDANAFAEAYKDLIGMAYGQVPQ